MPDESFIEILDENGNLIQVPLQTALAKERKKARAEEATLGIKRKEIPLNCIYLPDTPQALDFMRFSQEIRTLASFDFLPESQQQGYFMRCIQFYWQAKAILLPQKIFKLIPDPTELEQSLSQNLPEIALKNLQLETDAEKVVYHLVVAGESLIRDWAKNEGIDYPFRNHEDLFIQILKSKFQSSLSDKLFIPNPLGPENKKKQLADYRQWLKFLSDNFAGETKERNYLQVLRKMEWEGYWILALWEQKNKPPFIKLWKAYLKTQGKLVDLFDSEIHWRKGIAQKTKETSQILPIEAELDASGYITWHWPS